MIKKSGMYITVENGDDGYIHIKSFCKENDHQIFAKYLKNLLSNSKFDIDEHENHEEDGLFHHYGKMSVEDIIEMYIENGFEVR